VAAIALSGPAPMVGKGPGQGVGTVGPHHRRAEARLAAGNYGRSVRSGQPIPDKRLEADPLAELTAQEAAAAQRGALEEDDNAVGLVSAGHPFEVLADADCILPFVLQLTCSRASRGQRTGSAGS
jgi:hypothetical protein